jgi:hypothetical protein
VSFLKDLKKIEPKIPIVKQTVKQKNNIVKQKKKEPFDVNPKVKSIDDIPNTNIITSGKLIGIRLRAKKPKMLENLRDYINKLLTGEIKECQQAKKLR